MPPDDSDDMESTKVTQKEKPCKTYKFYVLEMFNHQECSADENNPKFKDQQAEVEEKKRDEEVRIVLEFEHKILEPLSDQDYASEGWSAYKKPTQHLYVSSDMKKLLEIVNRSNVNIYEVEDEKETPLGHKKVSWKRKHVVNRFSVLLQG